MLLHEFLQMLQLYAKAAKATDKDKEKDKEKEYVYEKEKEQSTKKAAPNKRSGVCLFILQQRCKKPHYPALELCKKALFFYAFISYSFAL